MVLDERTDVGRSPFVRRDPYRDRDPVREWRRQARLAETRADQYDSDPARRDLITQLLTLTGFGWILLVDRRWPRTSAGVPGLVLVGPAGVFVIASTDRASIEPELRRLAEQVEDAVAGEHVAPSVVTAIAVQPVGREQLGRVWRISAGSLLSTLVSLTHRLPTDAIGAVAGRLATSFPALQQQGPAGGEVEGFCADPTGFDVDLVVAAQQRAAETPALPVWMSILHPDQLSLVRRQFGGPARISGAPGTGKTVVGLHRAAFLAQRVDGPILYASMVRTLAQVQAGLFRTLTPGLADRVEFRGLNDWALRLLTDRGHQLHLDETDECWNAAWTAKGGPLAQLEPDQRYWKDEVAFVIKGRSVADLESYLELARPGRRMPLQRPQRHAVWDLYETYEAIKRQRGLVDPADLMLLALAEVRRDPPRYAAVIADEVQDLSVTAVKLLHALVGDGPNGLLLIGDGQQSVYPVGFPLAEAHITIRGARAETLRRNYRNGGSILRAAMRVAGADPYDDLDGTTVKGRPDVEPALHDGQVVNVVTRTAADLDRALIGIVHDLAEVRRGGLREVAVLCARSRDVEHYTKLLHTSGIAVQNLDGYDGQPTPAVKVGTVRRCKGLEFAVVLVPRFNQATDEARTGGPAEADRVALANRELYVAMTRARELLWLGQVKVTPRR